jgi:hypothetical protein
MVTGVYGSQGTLEKKMFIRELRHLKQLARPEWMMFGDFNLISRQQDKSNGRINRSLISRFQRAINHLQLRELNLIEKRFTWSNNHTTPTMSRIDKALCSSYWENIFDNPILQALSSSTSDHCPLLLTPHSAPPFQPKFRFHAFWVDMSGFKEAVLHSWNKDTPSNLNHMMTLHVKLGKVAKELRARSRRLVPHLKLTMALYREVILQLESAQEYRILLP